MSTASNYLLDNASEKAVPRMDILARLFDSTTRRVLEGILSQEQEHADELSDWLTP